MRNNELMNGTACGGIVGAGCDGACVEQSGCVLSAIALCEDRLDNSAVMSAVWIRDDATDAVRRPYRYDSSPYQVTHGEIGGNDDVLRYMIDVARGAGVPVLPL